MPVLNSDSLDAMKAMDAEILMATSLIYGHKVISRDFKTWYYEDTGERVDLVPKRPCPRCGRLPTAEGYDACLNHIPGVIHACCGHGIERGYVVKENGHRIEFDYFLDSIFGALPELRDDLPLFG